MRYLLLIAEEPPAGQPTQAEIVATMGDYNAFGSWLRERGWNEGGEALQDVTTATTVSVRDGQRIVTDGPYAETKEHLGGFYLIDVPSLDDAIEVASRIPGAQTGRGRGPPDPGDGLTDPGDVVARVFHEEHGRAIATLIRLLGDFDLAEEAVADAYVTALERWPADGIPANPGAWIVTTARNRAIDRARRAQVFAQKAAVIARDCGVRRVGAGRRAPGGGGGRDAPDPRRPAAAHLHVLSPGARAGGRRSRSRCARSAG